MTAGIEQREASPLAGRRIVFAGRLASLSRSAAASLVGRYGGTFSATVTQATDTLVVGRDGWPLRRNGRPSVKISRVEALRRAGQSVEVISEEEFLRRLGIFATEDTLGLHPLPTLSNLLGVSGRRLESWLRRGFLVAAGTRDGVPLFDFAGVAAARSVAELLAAGIEPRRIARSLIRLQAWLPDKTAVTAMSRLSLAAGCLAFPTCDGRWAEPHGQLLIDYRDAERAVAFPIGRHADELYQQAVTREHEGDLREAAELYRRLLDDGPDADVCLNLGNVLYALGKTDAAAERFRQAVELDATQSEAWNNLGNCLGDTGDIEGAKWAFRQAVAAEPDFVAAWENLGSLLDDAGEPDAAIQAYRTALAIDADNAEAHRAIATVLDDAGCSADAQRHWIEYLAREPTGEWADYARSRLGNGRRA